MIRVAAIALLVALAGCSTFPAKAKTADEVYNLYDIRMPGQLPGDPKPDKKWMHVKLVLKPDGSFTYQMDNRVMMTLTVDGGGTYTRSDGKIKLKGSAKSSMDDGYKKSNETIPLDYEYSIHGDSLFWTRGDSTLILLREGGKPPAEPPAPKMQPSNAGGKAMVIALRKRYASLRSYSDEGKMTSSGQGFMAKQAKFSTRFVRPHRFCFKVVSIDEGTEYDPRVVWSDGKKSWLYWWDSGYGSVHEQPIPHSFGIMMSSGPEVEFLPDLLLPRDFHDPAFSNADTYLAKPDQTVGGEPCAVLFMSTLRGDKETVWVSKKDGLVRQVRDDMTDATVVIRPRADVTVPTSELTYKPPRAAQIGTLRP